MKQMDQRSQNNSQSSEAETAGNANASKGAGLHEQSSEPANNSLLLAVIKTVVPLVILFVAFSGYSYLKATKPKPKKPQIVEKTWPVDSVTAIAKNHTPKLKLYGTTVANRRVDLRALVSGKITEVGAGLKEGALIKKGEILLKIDDFDYKGALQEAQANLAEAVARKSEMQASLMLEQENLKYAKVQLTLGEKDFKRAQALSKRGTVTKKLADDRNVVLSQRRQAVATSKVNLDLLRARQAQQVAVVDRLTWRVTQAKRRLEETQLIAPFDAYVSAVNAEIGRTMSVNDSVATLIDQNKIDVRFTLTNAQYGRILSHEKTLNGRKINVSWRVGETPILYKATIVRTGAVITSQSGGVEIFALVENPVAPVPLRSGAFVGVALDDREFKNVIRLPQTAIYSGNKIYLIINERLTERTVEIVGASGSDILVKANLPKKSKILTTRLTLAGEGVKVKVRSTKKDDPSKNKNLSQHDADKTPSSKGL